LAEVLANRRMLASLNPVQELLQKSTGSFGGKV